MDMVTRLILYILIANVGYVIFSLAGKGFRAFGGYIMQLGVLMLFMVLALLKAESGFWAVIGGLVGVFVLVGIPLIIQKQIERLISEQRFSEIEPLARWKAMLAWSEMNNHLLSIAQITAETATSEEQTPDKLKALIGKGKPYDEMTRVFLGMLLFHSRNFDRLLHDLLIPGRPFEEYPFEELLYIVRGFLETGNYEDAVLAQIALERQAASNASEELYGNLLVCRLIFFAFMGWEEDFSGLTDGGDKVLAGLPEPLKIYWRGFAFFNSGQFSKGESLMAEALQKGAEELPEHWIRWMESRLQGIRENKEFMFSAIVPKLAQIKGLHHPEYNRLICASSAAAKPRDLEDLATNWLLGLNFLVFVLVNIAYNHKELASLWSAGGWQLFSIPLLALKNGIQDMVVLVGSGANCGFLVAQGEWFRLLTYQFLHLGWIHLAMNLLALRYFGPSIETMTGAKIFVGSYLFCGVCGGLATVSSHAGISVGASASISGLLGMALIFEIFGKERKNFQGGKGYLPTLVFIIMINLAVGLVEKGIDNSAHVGGFAGGLLMGVLALFLLSRPILRILGELAAVFFVCGIFVFSSYQFRQSRDAGGYPGRFARMTDPAPASWPIYLRIPDGWEIVKPSEHVPTHALQGPLNERVDVVLATNHDPETEVLDEYLEERTKAMSETAELEFQTRLGPKIRQIGTKKFQEVKWRLAIDSHGLTERDFLLFEPGRLLLIQCILPTHDDEVYDKTILGMLETLRLK